MRRRPTLFLLLVPAAVAVLAAGCSGDDAADAEAPDLRTVDVDAFHSLVTSGEPIQLVDVRTPAEFAEGHLAGAVNIDFQSPDFDARIAELDADQPVAVYCRSGNRSGQAMTRMGSAGFTDVTNMGGGVVDWANAGYPLE